MVACQNTSAARFSRTMFHQLSQRYFIAWMSYARPWQLCESLCQRRFHLLTRGFCIMHLLCAAERSKRCISMQLQHSQHRLKLSLALLWLHDRSVVRQQKQRELLKLKTTCGFRLVVQRLRQTLHHWQRSFVFHRKLHRSRIQFAAIQEARNILRKSLLALKVVLQSWEMVLEKVLPFQRQREHQVCQLYFYFWHQATAEESQEKVKERQALLQRYAVMCSSVLAIWNYWFRYRREKKMRQADAKLRFELKERTAAVRLLLWRYDSKCSMEEGAAAIHIANEQRQRIERAHVAARTWRAQVASRKSKLCSFHFNLPG